MMNRAKYVGIAVASCLLIVVGVLAGARFLPEYWSESRHDHEHDDHLPVSHSDGDSTHSHESADPHGASATGQDDAEPSIVALTTQAMKNLQLEEHQVELSDSWRYIRVPAHVVEKPGLSNHSVAAPINGIVTTIYAVPGQAVSPGDDLFDLRVTDDELSKSQIELLQVMTRMDVIDIERRRIEPLIESGAMSGKVFRELEYERRELEAKTRLHTQALLMLGLSEEQVQTIVEKRELIRDFRVRLVGHGHFADDDGDSASSAATDPDYSVEELMALPGMTVKRGDDLCRISYHTQLYLHGRAFENELDQVVRAAEEGRPLIAEFGIAGAEYRREDLQIEYIDNHVNLENQTFSFYVPLTNEVQRDHVTEDGVRHRTWLFKPGQRANLLFPVEQWKDQIRLPPKAVVQEGANVYVFREVGHDHDEADPDAHDDEDAHDHADEDAHDHADFERVPVHLLYQDGESAVVANDGSLKIGDIIAANSAYQLNLELKASSESGGGHHGHHH